MYVRVIDLVIERFGATVMLTGGNAERELVDSIRSHVREENRQATLPLAGILPFPELCALIEIADIAITNNTGPMHIAAAVKTPVVALFALTNPPEQWRPWRAPYRQLYHDVSCRVCYSRVCPYEHECLQLVTPEMVVDAAADLMQETMPRLLCAYPVGNDYALSEIAGTSSGEVA